MRTFTVVPSFEGESAFFELPDIGFQGDHLSFAILFNLTELMEHWPNIIPSMIVTDPQNNTFIAPNTSWDSSTHIFTWNISNTETAYEGYLKCQLKCIAEDDPSTIVCMSRICQTRVYASLAATSDPPEAFQNWIDTLVQLGNDVRIDAQAILDSVEASETNARLAQSAADSAEISKNSVIAARESIEQTAQIAVNAQSQATQAQQRAVSASQAAESAKTDAIVAKEAAEAALEETDLQASAAAASATSASDSAAQAATSMSNARTAQAAAEAAQEAAEVSEGEASNYAETALSANRSAEAAQAAAEAAQSSSQNAQAAAETAQGLAESAQTAAETAQRNSKDYAELSKKWSIGKDANGNPVSSSDQTYQNNSKYWAERSADSASVSNAAKDVILNTNVSTVRYSSDDSSLTFFLGGDAVVNGHGGVSNG